MTAEHDYRRNCCTRKALMAFTVVIVLTTALIFLCAQFAVSPSKAAGLETVVNNTLLTGGGDAVVQLLGPISVVAASVVDVSSTTEDALKIRLQKREQARFIVPEGSRAGKKVLTRHSVVENLSRLDIGKSGDINLDRLRYHFRHDRHKVSGNQGTTPFVNRENSSIRILHSIDQHEEDLRADVSNSKVAYHVNRKPNHRRIRNNNYSTIHTPLVQKHVPSRYYKSNYSTDDGNEKKFNRLDESVWTAVINPARTVDEKYVSKFPGSRDTHNDTSSRPLDGSTVQDFGNSFEHNPMRRISTNTPSILPPSTGQIAELIGTAQQATRPVITSQQTGLPAVLNPSYPSYQQQYATPAPAKRIRWRTIGLVLALVKLGLVKLVAYGILRILLLVLFKLKIILAALFLKLIFLLKFTMFFKLQALPLLILLSLPVLASVVYPAAMVGLPSVTGLIMNTILGHVNTAAQPTSISPLKASSDHSLSDTKTSIIRESQMPHRDVDETLLTHYDVSEPTVDHFDLIGGRRIDLPESSYPALSFFRKAIDSEKCVERIACELALAKITGSTFSWIDWIAHQISKLIPNNKFILYLKTYGEVSKDINISRTQNNWETWCLKHYNCNSINEIITG